MSEAPSVVAVSGHMVDVADRPQPRFPQSQVGRVAMEVDATFEAWRVGPGTTIVCGGARGADIVAAEAGLRRGARVEVHLALPADEFEQQSVRLPGTDWSARFHHLLAHPAVATLPPASPVTASEDVFARANVRLVERARRLATSPHALLVWNGESGDGPGGTADFVRRLGFTQPDPRVRVIDPTPRRYETRQTKPGPKKLLALDGGGIRGVLTLEVLLALEQQLRSQRGDPDLRLADYFDYIGGTSTGAIIAAALAMGRSVGEVQERYTTLAAKIFQKRFLPMRLRSLYRDGPLTAELDDWFGAETTFGDPEFWSLLLIVLHNTGTDSPWPLSNCTRATYNGAERYLNQPADRNLDLRLTTLVRGSTAAPIYFPPQRIDVGSHEFVFQDGGLTPFNNPALLLFLMATLPEYGLGWPTGAENVLVVSVGTGSAAAVHPGLRPGQVNLLFNASNLPQVVMRGASVGQDLLCRAFGTTRAGASVDREFGARLGASGVGEQSLFTYVRYDADLSPPSLADLGIAARRDQLRLRKLDAVNAIEDLRTVGQATAGRVDVSQDMAGFD